MKYLSSQLSVLFPTGETRTDVAGLVKYFAFLVLLVSVYAVVFHLIMVRIEGQQHSWITGFYWTLVVMTTLGFGDITFTSDVGRLFSIVVLLSGVVFLLVPRSLAGQPLAKTGIGSRTGLSVVAVDEQGALTTMLTADTVLPRGGKRLMLGSEGQRQQFAQAVEAH